MKVSILMILLFLNSCVSGQINVYSDENLILIGKQIVQISNESSADLLIVFFENGCNKKKHDYVKDIHRRCNELFAKKGLPDLDSPIVSNYILFVPQEKNAMLSDTVYSKDITFTYKNNEGCSFSLVFLRQNDGWCFNDMSVQYMSDSAYSRFVELLKNPPVIPASAIKK